MIKFNIFLLTMTLSIFGCRKSDSGEDLVLDLHTDMRLVNKSGENLLDPSTPNNFNTNTIKVYYLLNGQKIEMSNTNLDAPRQYMIYQVEAHSNNYPGEYLMRIYLNKDGIKNSSGAEEATTYIQWNNAQTDTLVTQIRRTGSSIFTEKISYNGVVKWDITSTPKIEDTSFPGRFFQIMK